MNEFPSSLEKQSYQKTEILGLSPEKEAFLKEQDNFDAFALIMKSSLISPEEKEKVLKILNNTGIWELEVFFGWEWFTLVDEAGIKDFINTPEFTNILKDLTVQQKDLTVQQKEETISEKIKNFKEQYSQVKDILLRVSKNDKELGIIVSKLNGIYDGNEDNLESVIQELSDYLSKDNNATKVFSELQNDSESYEALYKFLQNSGNENLKQVLQTIPPNSREFQIGSKRAQAILDSSPYFPEISGKNISKLWNIIQAKMDDKTFKVVDMGNIPPKTYIVWKNSYKIETQTLSQETLNIRSAFTKEKIRMQNQIENNSKQILFYNEVLQGKNINTLWEELKNLENKNPKTLEDETRMFALQEEIKTLEEIIGKLQKLQIENEKLEKEFSQKEQEFLHYYTLSIGKEQEKVKNQDKQAKETIDFLETLWITFLNQNDLQQIINRINIHPHIYWFSKPFDLKEWFSGTPTDALKQKKEFFNLFSKIYEKAWFIPPPNQSIIHGFTKDERLLNETTFKQKLEDAWITKWGSIQLETTMKILSSKSEKEWN